ncbi:hypothetical protein L6452_22005 [Arctium lappa]|uniref:Uncharacterized protein n=1 Tax=Arctium lappa TaxID=4217 RepID=A0ACB9AY74_ARCLA|nr:hypothetical protein L6452_22005 [Arctium lappa]
MDLWPEFLASSWGKEFVAGGFGGIAGIMAGYPQSVTVNSPSRQSVQDSQLSHNRAKCVVLVRILCEIGVRLEAIENGESEREIVLPDVRLGQDSVENGEWTGEDGRRAARERPMIGLGQDSVEFYGISRGFVKSVV